MTTTQHDAQVTTLVQQIDAQGPMVVERITTQFADVTCTPENARKLVEALHSGTAVTLTSNVSGEAKTATFTPTGSKLGYGEAYIALALASEALKAAGISGCATPEQWQAVLLGGPLTVAGSSGTSSSKSIATASSSARFPGVLALRTQGQGWGQIAQTTNVQLGQVVSSARTSLMMDSSTSSSSADRTLSPTGRSSAEMNQSSGSSATGSSATPGARNSSGLNSDTNSSATRPMPGSDRAKDKDDAADTSSPSSTRPGASSSTPSSSSGSSGSSTTPRTTP